MAGRRKILETMPSAELPVGEIKRLHTRQWLLLGVTRRNERDEPTHGHLLFASKNEDQALKQLDEQLAQSSAAYSGIAVFWADPRFAGVVPGLPELA